MRASINGTRIAFDDVGRGPAVILIHGFPCTRQIWEPQIDCLADRGFRVIAPDLRGFGESDAGDKPFSIRLMSDDIAKLMKHLGIGRAVLVGMSLGGEIVMELLKRYPRKVVAAKLIAPLLPAVDAAERNRLWGLAELVREGHIETALAGICHWYFAHQEAGKKAATKERFHELSKMVLPDTLAGGLAYWESYQGRTGRRQRHSHPVLLLTAEHDQISPPERAAELLGLFSRGRHQVLAGTGRMLNLDSPEVFNQALLDFLEEISHCKPGRLRLAVDRVKSGLGFNVPQGQEEDPDNIQEGAATA